MESNRFYRRSDLLNVPVSIAFENEPSKKFVASMVSIGPGGLRVETSHGLSVGDRVIVSVLNPSTISLDGVTIEITWDHLLTYGECVYGGKFISLNEQQKALLQLQLPRLYPPDQRTKGKTISLILKIGIGLIMPLVFLSGFLVAPRNPSIILFLFIYVITLMRVWETFLTPKDPYSFRDSADWTITAVVFYYIIMLIGITFETTFLLSHLIPWVTALGVVLYSASFGTRLYCMRLLGKNWGIHITSSSIGEKVSPQSVLIRSGPYRYLRHPIYLSVIVELISVPLIFNAFVTFGLVVLVNIPLQILRSKFEEQILLSVLGGSYASYVLETGGLLPKQKVDDTEENKNRKHLFSIDFPDRRKR